jgi:hypothetical protein
MSEFLSCLHHATRYSHIALGFVGLALFWVPVLTPKGGRVHRVSGKIFAAIALWVGLTGYFGSLWAVADPFGFTASLGRTVSASARPYVAEELRFGFGFLAFLSIATVSGVILGVATAWTKTRHEALRTPWVTVPLRLTVLTAFALAINGGWNLWLGWRGEHLLAGGGYNRYWVHVILGVFGVLGTRSDLRYVYTTPTGKREWFYKHMECMLGTGIAFYTAFLVFGAGRLYKLAGIELQGAWRLLPWLLPGAIGLPLIARWQSHYRRKFGDLVDRKDAETGREIG